MSGSEKFKRLACLAFFVIVIVGCSANVGTPTEIFNKTDLEISESNPKVVGVKKHKNYEIVVYEYDESGEGKDGKNKDVDVDNPEITDNSVEIPIMDHPTSAPTKKSRGSSSSTSKPNLSHDSESDEEPKKNTTAETDDVWGIDKALKCEDPTGKPGICQEYARCSIFYQELLDDYDEPIEPADYKCRLPTQVGICCPLVSEDDVISEPERKSSFKPISVGKRKQKRKVINPQIRRLIRTNLNNSFDYGDFFLEELHGIEQNLLSRSVQVSRNTPEFGHNKFFPTSKRIRQISDIGLSLLQTSNDISERLQLTNEIGGRGLKNFKSSNIEALNDRCPFQRPCRTSKYRTSDGSCNNLQKPKMGQSLTPLARILEPVYADGRWVPRVSVRGFELPSARLLSQSFIGDRNLPDNRYTLMVMQFGQFLDHDLTSVPVFTFANNSGINCCSNGRFLSPDLRHPNCFPIEIPSSDPFYSRFGQRCMNFVRSRMAPRIDCSLGYADQMNALTHWIDASNIYGSTDEQTRQLRLFQGGLLRFSELGDGKMLLPVRNTGQGVVDYRAGDDRVNEMQGLMIMHLVWFREHNRLAFELARLNPFWSDEELFQEARRITIAEYQHVIYNEWLPIIIGRKYMEKAGVVPLTKGYYKGYDPKIDASIANAFSSAAFRMGHTLVQGLVRLIDEMGRDNEVSVISQNDENTVRTRQPNQVDKWLRGMAQQPTQSYDPFITEHLNGRLFQGSNGAFGMDLSSLNIQRSRDHGVPGYNSYRELCQVGRRARTFDDFKDWIAPETADRLSLFYAHPDDVDLWIGGISERPLPGALVGPTFACIIGDQFTRSKKGDRYFYDIADQVHSFSPEQLGEIRKVTFARILCDNGDDLEALQPAAFLQADFDFNSLVDCKRSTRIPRMNLRLWQKEPTPVI
ncbi:Chorion peroxidase [Orchesella cincta]|uniref:Chorion peroxidase n=1 Tax=Orchesella cincta TaxID=48709 RepID=A0A1D2MUF1_ORCCI|nr:Chorion peroxidase [Orchesella cincta]